MSRVTTLTFHGRVTWGSLTEREAKAWQGWERVPGHTPAGEAQRGPDSVPKALDSPSCHPGRWFLHNRLNQPHKGREGCLLTAADKPSAGPPMARNTFPASKWVLAHRSGADAGGQLSAALFLVPVVVSVERRGPTLLRAPCTWTCASDLTRHSSCSPDVPFRPLTAGETAAPWAWEARLLSPVCSLSGFP